MKLVKYLDEKAEAQKLIHLMEVLITDEWVVQKAKMFDFKTCVVIWPYCILTGASFKST